MTQFAATTTASASAAPLLLSLLGTAVMLCFVLRPALSQERKLWKALRGLAPRAAALLGVALLVLFVQIGGSLNKNAPERDGVTPLWDNADSEQLAGENRDSSASAIPVDTLYITDVVPLTNSVYRLTLQWDSCAYYPAHTLDVWATTNLLAGPWAIACSTNIWDISFETNRVDVIVTNAADTAFFRLASREDTDGDGLTDAEEALVHGTDPEWADTDLDGINDGTEILACGNPLDPDEDDDGVPDGWTAPALAAHSYWGGNAGSTNVVVTLLEAVPAASKAILQIGDLPIPLTTPQTFSLSIPAGQVVPFRLYTKSAPGPSLQIDSPLFGTRVLRGD